MVPFTRHHCFCYRLIDMCLWQWLPVYVTLYCWLLRYINYQNLEPESQCREEKQTWHPHAEKTELRLRPYIPQCFTVACGQPQECSKLPVQAPLQIASSQQLLQGSTLYPKQVLNQEAPANIEVPKHTAGSRLRCQKRGSGRRREERKCLEWIL